MFKKIKLMKKKNKYTKIITSVILEEINDLIDIDNIQFIVAYTYTYVTYITLF